jgi:predicted nucleic acid-binding protein
MSVLIDTNILLRVAQTDHSAHPSATSAVIALREAGDELCLVPQVLYEYWVVATRPISVNGLGMTTAEAERTVKLLLEDFTLRLDERGIFGHWQSLVSTHDVKGKNAHDARLVAAMRRHGLVQLLTFNAADFARYPDIDVVTPTDVLVGRPEGRPPQSLPE